MLLLSFTSRPNIQCFRKGEQYPCLQATFRNIWHPKHLNSAARENNVHELHIDLTPDETQSVVNEIHARMHRYVMEFKKDASALLDSLQTEWKLEHDACLTFVAAEDVKISDLVKLLEELPDNMPFTTSLNCMDYTNNRWVASSLYDCWNLKLACIKLLLKVSEALYLRLSDSTTSTYPSLITKDIAGQLASLE